MYKLVWREGVDAPNRSLYVLKFETICYPGIVSNLGNLTIQLHIMGYARVIDVVLDNIRQVIQFNKVTQHFRSIIFTGSIPDNDLFISG